LRRLAVLFALSAAQGAGAAELEPVEDQIARFVDSRLEESIALLQRLVDINSGSLNREGVEAVAGVLRGELDALGFETRWVPGDAFQRAGHLVAEHDGSGPRLLLIGHLDTVFEPDSPFQSFTRDGWSATGPGALDMKGGDVVMLAALQALAHTGELEGMSLSVILTGDEESTGQPLEEARRELVTLARRSDFALGFEDGDGDPGTAVIARRGSSSWRLETRGVRAHSSLIHSDGVGSGAIHEMARVLAAFHEIREPNLTLSPGLVLGGTRVDWEPEASRGAAFGKENVVPETAFASGDLRAASPEQLERVKQRMHAAAAASLPGTGAELVIRDSYPPMAPGAGNRRLLEMFDAASRDLGTGPVAPADLLRLGAADVSFAAPWVSAALDGLGPGGDGGHTVRERVDLRTLAVQAKRAALLMRRLARGDFSAEASR
jgi:glutamate carboxypeptidase